MLIFFSVGKEGAVLTDYARMLVLFWISPYFAMTNQILIFVFEIIDIPIATAQ